MKTLLPMCCLLALSLGSTPFPNAGATDADPSPAANAPSASEMDAYNSPARFNDAGTRPILRFGFSDYAKFNLGKAGEVALGDINGDGLDDVVFATRNGSPADSGNFFAIHERYPDGSFAPYRLAPQVVGGWFRGLLLRDLDGDGMAEIVSGTDRGFAILRRNDLGGFDTKRFGEQASLSKDIAVADVDRDGVLDILTLNAAQISTYYGDGHGGISRQAHFASQPGASLALAHFNNDTFPDVAVRVAQGAGRPTLAVYLHDGTDGFVAGASYTPGGDEGASAMAVGSLNGDKLTDVILVRSSTSTSAPSSMWLLKQLVPGSLVTYTMSSAQQVRNILIHDVDNNGEVDLLATHPSGALSLWTQIGGALSGERLLDLGISGAIAFGNLNDDGCTDAATVQGNTVVLLAGYGCR